MAISYASSTPYHSDPYVIPMDLGIMAKVLSVKQEKYDQTAQSIQQGINQAGAADILKPQDKEYLNMKVNKLVNDINGFGGVDLSDPNIASQIQGIGGDVYNDKNVINAITGTKLVRNLQSQYQQYKTNPKLSKLYSIANEHSDMQGVQQYIANPEIGATYNGVSSPTPYVPYKENLIKNIQGVKANLIQSKDANGNLIYVTSTKEEISPERVIQMAKDLSSADEVAQMERDGLYQYRGIDPNTLLTKAIDLHNDKIQTAASTLNRYNNLYLQSTNDPESKKSYESLIQKQQEELKALTTLKGEDFVKRYTEDPEGFKKSVYMDEFYRGLGNRFAYSKNTVDIKPNYAEMFNVRMAQAERFHEDEMNLKYYQTGVKKDKNGNVVGGLDDATGFTITPPNTQDVSKIPTGQEAIDLKIKDYTSKNTELASKWIADLANDNPEISQVLQSQQSPTGYVTTVKGYDYLEGVNNKPGLQIEDFNLIPGSAQYAEALKRGIPEKELQILYNAYQSYDQLATGTDKGIKELPRGLENLVKQMELNNSAINAFKTKKDAVNLELAKKYNISQDDADFYNEYTAVKSGIKSDPYGIRGEYSPETYSKDSQNYLTENYSRYKDIADKLGSTDYNKDKKLYYDQVDNRIQYEHAILGKDNLGNMKFDDAKNLAASLLYTRGGKDSNGKDIQPHSITLSDKDVEPQDAGKSADGTYLYTFRGKSADGKSIETYTVNLEPENVRQFGFLETPYQAINDEVNMLGKSSPKLLSAQTNPNIPDRQPLRAKVVVVQDSNKVNHAYMLNANGGKEVDIPFTTTDRPDKSYAAVEALLQTSENQGMTREQFIQFCVQNRNR